MSLTLRKFTKSVGRKLSSEVFFITTPPQVGGKNLNVWLFQRLILLIGWICVVVVTVCIATILLALLLLSKQCLARYIMFYYEIVEIDYKNEIPTSSGLWKCFIWLTTKLERLDPPLRLTNLKCQMQSSQKTFWKVRYWMDHNNILM